jgi:D-alanyl-lipoteichoic acid acyltransferase DltB (MBOAT superfamily)
MLPQFARSDAWRLNTNQLAIGFGFFVIGLLQKTVLADPLAAVVASGFADPAHLTFFPAWQAACSYSLQLYFDFSGYSDMAIGLSLLFGVRLPLNFNSPYKARNISDFWRRWHMTLSRFLRDYLYIALGGNRAGRARCSINLMATMVLGGLWHGAGWTFVAWGALHGCYLVLHQGWLRWRGARGAARSPASAGTAGTAWWAAPLTFVAVMLAWVVFRAPDLATACDILAALVGGNGVSLPRGLAPYASHFQVLGWQPGFSGIRWIDFGGMAVPVLLLAMALAFFAPNTQEIFCRYEPCIEKVVQRGRWTWSPSSVWSVTMALLFLCCLLNMNKVSEFLYFQF